MRTRLLLDVTLHDRYLIAHRAGRAGLATRAEVRRFVEQAVRDCVAAEWLTGRFTRRTRATVARLRDGAPVPARASVPEPLLQARLFD